MIKTNELKGIIACQGLSQRKVARHLGITDKTFYDKMKKGVFSSKEIEKMLELLHIEDVEGVFFAKTNEVKQ